MTEGIFAVLYVSIMGLTRCYKMTVFLHLGLSIILLGHIAILRAYAVNHKKRDILFLTIALASLKRLL